MKLHAALLFAGLSLLPTMAGAQTSGYGDAAYCKALSDVYLRYVGRDETSTRRIVRRSNDLDAQVALTQCSPATAASAIPILERQLISNHLTLPARG